MAGPTYMVRRCYLATEDGPSLPVAAFQVEYSLNNIPTGYVLVPLGFTSPGGYYSSGYYYLYGINRRVFLWVDFRSANAIDPNVSAGLYLVFAGYATNSEYVYAAGKTYLKINLIHWLSDLESSAVLSAYHSMPHPKAINEQIKFFSLQQYIYNLLSPSAVKSNLWTGGIAPLFNVLMTSPHLNYQQIGLMYNDTRDQDAWFAFNCCSLAALPLINITNESTYCVLSYLSTAIQTQSLFGAFATHHSTVWQKLQELAAAFLFSIIPRPLDYLAVPIALGAYGYYKIIPSSSVLGIYYKRESEPEPSRGVMLFAKPKPSGDAVWAAPNLAKIDTVGGWYVSPLNKGIIQLLRPPVYLQMPYDPIRAQNLSEDYLISVCAAHTVVLSMLARYYYVNQQIKDRMLVVRCPFRGDICPGSTIGVITGGGNLIPDILDRMVLYGTVMKVIYSLEIGKTPTTEYFLVGVRNYYDMFNPDYTLPTHPLYGTHFLGYSHLPLGV